MRGAGLEQSVDELLGSGCWPISGCVEQRLARDAGSPLTAACAASRSYAVTCCISPSSSGATGACGSGFAPAAPTSREHLDHVVVGEALDRPVVAHVDDVRLAVSAASAPTSPIAASL